MHLYSFLFAFSFSPTANHGCECALPVAGLFAQARILARFLSAARIEVLLVAPEATGPPACPVCRMAARPCHCATATQCFPCFGCAPLLQTGVTDRVLGQVQTCGQLFSANTHALLLVHLSFFNGCGCRQYI